MIDVTLHLAPVTVRVRSPFATVRRHLETFYPDALHGSGKARHFIDFDIHITHGTGWRRWLRPQARFFLDHAEPFLPLPATQAAPLFEWGLNWCLASRPLGYLVMHAAVVARDDDALVMPGAPGAGKSTLCAALTFIDQWRLLSDELAILAPECGTLQPNPRPISLKNESIDIVSRFPGTRLGRRYTDTRKGTISHAAPPATSHSAAARQARCRWVIFPRFVPGSAPRSEEIGRAEAFARIAEQSFNRDRMGETGFHALCEMLDKARCFDIAYDSTDTALAMVRSITGR
ncbi:HprK-related kinase A [Aromatoleum petrolei]|uniref:HprK-related kinase A n=1 Tax=Aromatoleum petrolei TaxID=76116 RepID=A0ABX1MGD3_9RHOO|nr:HprK-related kinase A [Aromatoleum petrolei]NMF86960.1 HprK-related kinase A [Aromatoleum petrolei]QTQ37554.1 HprK-related kinase A family protein [Aromatoleum petrolei]